MMYAHDPSDSRRRRGDSELDDRPDRPERADALQINNDWESVTL